MNRMLQRQKRGNVRRLSIVDGQIDFASNDTLGLARSKRLKKDCEKEWGALKGLGATGSRLLTGNSRFAETLEDEIAQFHGFESALLFGCGYMANVGLFSSLDEEILFDVLSHASIYDGIKLGSAKALPFRHHDLAHLEKRLKGCKGAFIAVESITSTDGSIAPLKEIVALAKEYEAHVIVDEAHAVGLYGRNGRGLVDELGLTNDVFALVVTFGKALGTYGAAVLGSHAFKERLINWARSCIYTTALPYYCLAFIKMSYRLLPELDSERDHVKQLIKRFQGASASHIQPIKCPGNDAVKQKACDLLREGFDVRPLTSPTVQRGEELLRICLHSFNTFQEVESLKRCL